MSDLDNMTVKQLKREVQNWRSIADWYKERMVWGFYCDEKPVFYQGEAGENDVCDPVTADEVNHMIAQIDNLKKALEIYQRERDRFKHAHPEITGAYFLTGGHGEKDANQLPEYVTVCPAYGAGWEQVYEKTDRTISYEGS